MRGRVARAPSIEVSVSPYMKPARDADSLRAYADAGVDQVIYMAAGDKPEALRAEIRPLAATGAVAPLIWRTLPLAKAAEAHRILEANENIGKVLLLP